MKEKKNFVMVLQGSEKNSGSTTFVKKSQKKAKTRDSLKEKEDNYFFSPSK